MDHAPLRIAIIGGGVSGLSLAYYLQKLGCQKLGHEMARQIEVTLFERKASLGGNAETVWVDLGVRRHPGKPETPYRRWADLGAMTSTWPPTTVCARYSARSASWNA
ncbi:FAD-dependent oxidoreductase [Billgrantia tianxiuensis]|uniref:FAD-dependent oxidoreductase n=1 Tax=Billgrantia tianxiuensis TaxID=2497861 RepID=UPI001F289318|nr:FAD-dependent oxidoreductase [Halomonas tianxiuensis]